MMIHGQQKMHGLSVDSLATQHKVCSHIFNIAKHVVVQCCFFFPFKLLMHMAMPVMAVELVPSTLMMLTVLVQSPD